MRFVFAIMVALAALFGVGAGCVGEVAESPLGHADQLVDVDPAPEVDPDPYIVRGYEPPPGGEPQASLVDSNGGDGTPDCMDCGPQDTWDVPYYGYKWICQGWDNMSWTDWSWPVGGEYRPVEAFAPSEPAAIANANAQWRVLAFRQSIQTLCFPEDIDYMAKNRYRCYEEISPDPESTRFLKDDIWAESNLAAQKQYVYWRYHQHWRRVPITGIVRCRIWTPIEWPKPRECDPEIPGTCDVSE